MSAKSKSLLQFNAKWIGYAHTVCALSAFLSALAVGCWLHYLKIVQNGFYGYPDEWFPSVSATIGDRYPERSLFQVLIALTAGPRFLLLFFCYLRLYRPGSKLNALALVSGIIRTFTCGGWVYITSTDDHDFHDIFMISYIVLTIPWTVGITLLTEKGSQLRKYRKFTSLAFFASLVPLVYLFIQHKVHRVPGAYSYYAYVEWSLIFLDIGFDAWTISDFQDITVELTATDNGSVFLQTVENSNRGDFKNIKAVKDELKTINHVLVNFSYFQFLVNIVNAFMFWSIQTSLFLCIWHFPLWYMGISGYEAVITTILSPIILVIPSVKRLYISKPAIPRILAVLFTIGSYKIQDPANRLLSISVGSFLSCASLASEISYFGKSSKGQDKSELQFYAVTFGSGLMLSAIAKLAFWTNNPIWPIMHKENGGCNLIGVIVGVFAAYFTPKSTKLTSPEPSSAAKESNSLFMVSLGVGGLMFNLSSMLTDTSTIILWCWDGYPVTGPKPLPHGLLTLTAMAIGIYLGLKNLKLVSSWKYFAIGCMGGTILYAIPGWVGYIGGFVFAVFSTSLIPVIFISISPHQPGLVLFLGFFWQMLLTLAHVWVVAYAFVPGGFLLRERTDLVLGITLALMGAGVKAFKQLESVSKDITILDDKVGKSSNNTSGILAMKSFRFLTLLLVLASAITFKRFNVEEPQPYHAESKLITAGVWTIHFGLDNDMWASEYRMRDLIKDAEVDIIGLIESDNQRLIMGNRDLTQFLSEDLGMYADYGPGPNKHTWGCALLSKFPILNSTHHLLPSPVGELAPAIHATLDVYGELVDVVVFHSGQEEDVEDRRLQSLGVAEIMGSSDRPMILLSYLVTTPLEGNYNTYVSEKSGMHDIDPTDWDRWCEYILFKKLKRTGYARISRSSITDTELQLGKFVLTPKDTDESKLYTNERIEEEEVPVEFRFPDKFYGDGIRDHKFHVLDDKPRYFA